MDPALARRVEQSVTGSPGHARAGGRRLVALARVVGALVVALALGSFVSARRGARSSLEGARAELLDQVRAQSAGLTPVERDLAGRVAPWLLGAAGEYPGDLVAPELARPGALAERLAEPAVYVRGPIAAFTTPAGLAGAAAASAKDALLLCLVEPPAARTEKVMLGRVRVAYTGGAEARTPNLRRLDDAYVGLPLLQPPWEERVQRATDPRALRDLRRQLERAPIASAKRAAKAKLLLYAMDEPGRGGGPTEVDGERPHEVRVGLVDLSAGAQGKLLLRLRKAVDPAWISEASRVQFALGLDACRLALDVHEAVGRN